MSDPAPRFTWTELLLIGLGLLGLVDILVLAAGVFVLMFAECRRLGIASGESACSGRPNRSNRRAPTGWPSGSPSRSWWCPWATASGTFPGA